MDYIRVTHRVIGIFSNGSFYDPLEINLITNMRFTLRVEDSSPALSILIILLVNSCSLLSSSFCE